MNVYRNVWDRADDPCDDVAWAHLNGVEYRCDRPKGHADGHSHWTSGFVLTWRDRPKAVPRITDGR